MARSALLVRSESSALSARMIVMSAILHGAVGLAVSLELSFFGTPLPPLPVSIVFEAPPAEAKPAPKPTPEPKPEPKEPSQKKPEKKPKAAPPPEQQPTSPPSPPLESTPSPPPSASPPLEPDSPTPSAAAPSASKQDTADKLSAVLRDVGELTRQAQQEQDHDTGEQKLSQLVAQALEDSRQAAENNAGEALILSQLLENRLDDSEIEALRRQLADCWNPPVGARAAEELIVEIRLVLNPDATVQEAMVVDMKSDPFFRAAADSALRAVLNPRCSPLRLPKDKFSKWQVTLLRFDMRAMLGYI